MRRSRASQPQGVAKLVNTVYGVCMGSAGRVADVLRRAREANGQSLRGAAKELGVDPSYLSRVESGERTPSPGLRERAEQPLWARQRHCCFVGWAGSG